MAYAVLIVDDDARIREGLIRHIDWQALGFNIPMQAPGGQEALEIFKYQRVDVLITDIRMPVISGLELSKKISNSYNETIIVILSGYSDFEYAKTAMKYGIKHYITKPTDLKQLSKTLIDIKNELDTRKRRLEQVKDLEKRYNEAVKMLLEQFFIDISHGAIKSEVTVQNFMSQYDIQFPFFYFNIVTVELIDFENTAATKWKYDSNQFLTSIKNMLKTILNDYNIIYYTYSTTNKTVNIIVNFDDIVNIRELSEKLYNYCKTMDGIEAIIAVSSNVTNIQHISICYDQIQEIISYSRHNNSCGIIQYKDIESENLSDINYPVEKERLLLSYISNMDMYKAQNIIHNIFLPFDYYDRYLDICREYMVKLLFAIESHLSTFNFEIKDFSGERLSPLKKSLELGSIKEIVSWLNDFVSDIINNLCNTNLSYSYRFVEKIKAYIEKNYMSDITLFSASEEIHLSPNYISKIFKKTTGYNFIEYLSITRVNEAKALLSNIDTKIYEISSLVGYKSTKHFSQVFKSYTGMTPTEYREKINVIKDVKLQ